MKVNHFARDILAQTNEGFSWIDNHAWILWIIAVTGVVIWIIFDLSRRDYRKGGKE